MVFTLFFSVIDEMHTPDKSNEKSEVSMHPELAKVGLRGRIKSLKSNEFSSVNQGN